ncbi:MFS transporter, partial [Bacillus nitratireducens]|nr:MFS transporter [Bacillus nitratireducens]
LALFFDSINLRIGITTISPLLETIRQDLSISTFSVSFLTALPVFFMGTFDLLTGKAIQTYGADKAIMTCLILIGFATCMRAFTSSIS